MKRKKTIVTEPFQDYRYLEPRAPKVLLAYGVDDEHADERYALRKRYVRKFARICHQHSGVACGHTHMIAVALPFAKGYSAPWQVWCDQHDGSNMGVLGTSLVEINEYETFLKGLQLTCNTSYMELGEAIYPVDCSTDNVKTLTGIRFKQDFDDEFLHFKSVISRLCGCMGRWHLYVVCENSD